MRPNLVFLNVDQLSALDSITGLGAEGVQTPAIDRLLANGQAFSRAFPADPVCCPSRTSWWTGRYSSEHGTSLNDTPCHPDMGQHIVTNHLREVGVRPYFVGKWHVEGLDVRRYFHVLHEASWWGELTDQDITASACSFLANYRQPEPFFLNLGYMNPHDICISPCNDLGRTFEGEGGKLSLPYLRDGILQESEIPPLSEARLHPQIEPHLQWAWNRFPRRQQQAHRYDDMTWRMHRYNYLRWIEMVDREIGCFLDALEASPHKENTYILFASDHGEGMSRHKAIGKNLFYREIVEIPLILSTLGSQLPLPKGKVDRSHLISGVDVAPTICDLMGADASLYPHGRSLGELLKPRPPVNWRTHVYLENAFSARLISDGKLKYVRDYHTELEDFRVPGPDTHKIFLEQLFDIEAEPTEHRSLLHLPEYAKDLDKLRNLMDEKERSLFRRHIPGDHGRNWLRQKISLCQKEGYSNRMLS